MLCVFCDKKVNTGDPINYQRHTGWCRPRKSGGLNALVLHEPLQEWAHYECVEKARRGLLGQEALL